MSRETIQEITIPAKEYFSVVLYKGQTLRVIDAEGKQVPDLVAISAKDKEEKLSCVYSNILNGTWQLTKGHILYSNKANPMLSIIEDLVGLHYSGGGFCSMELNYLRYKDRNMRNCADNLTMAFKSHEIERRDFNFDCCFNIFMNLTFQPDGTVKLDEPLSKAGDYIDLKAEMDCIIGISNCPQDRNPCNGFNPTSLKIIVFND